MSVFPSDRLRSRPSPGQQKRTAYAVLVLTMSWCATIYCSFLDTQAILTPVFDCMLGRDVQPGCALGEIAPCHSEQETGRTLIENNFRSPLFSMTCRARSGQAAILMFRLNGSEVRNFMRALCN